MRSAPLLVTASFVFFTSLASAQTFDFWKTNGSGTFQTASNWSLGVPGSGDIAVIAPGNGNIIANSIITITLDPAIAPISPTVQGIILFNGGSTTGGITLNLSSANTLTIAGSNPFFSIGLNVDSGLTLNITGQTDGTGGTVVVQSNGVNVGDPDGSGTLNITAGTLDASATTYHVGGGAGSTSKGTASQSGSSTVLAGNFIVGQNNGQGVYTMSGTSALTIGTGGNFFIGSGATGTFTQTGGTLTVGTGSTATIGNGSSGTYTFSGGSADFKNGFTVGDGSTGTFTQNTLSGNTVLTSENQLAIIGANGGTGTYSMSGTSATFSAGLQLGDTFGGTGTMTQTAGIVTIGAGNNLNLASAGSAYTFSGGTLKIGGNGVTTGIIGPGTFNWSGGTLQAFGTNLVVPFGGIFSSAAGLDSSFANITVNGNLSGTGGLTISGNNIVTLNGINTYQGGTTITGGTLRADLVKLPVARNIRIGSGSTLDLTPTTTDQTYTGTITGSGNLLTPASHLLELTNTAGVNNLNITIGNAGTLQVFSGIFGNIPSSTGNLVIGGDASVATSGTVNLAGTNSYTGLTTINSGFTVTSNGFAGSVNNSGTLGFNSTVPIGTTFSIGGGSGGSGFLTQNAPGGFIVRTNGITADGYSVASALTLNGNLYVSGSGQNNYVIVQTGAGGLTPGASALNVVILGSPPLFSASLEPVTGANDQLILDTIQLPISSLSLALTPNQQAVSNTIDQVIVNPPAGSGALFTAINALTIAQIPGALDQLSPENLQYMRDIAFENSTFMVQEVNGYLANLRNGYSGLDTSGITLIHPGFNSSMGRSLGSLLAYNPPSFNRAAPNGINYYPQDDSYSSSPSSSSPISRSSSRTISDSPDPLTTLSPTYATTHYSGPNFSGFIGGNVVLADLNQNQSALNAAPGKASYTAGSATAGVSFRVTANLAVGALVNYNHTDAKTDSNGSKIKVDSYSPGIYGTFFKDGFYANGLFSYGYNSYSETRNISFAGLTAKGSPNGSQYVGNLDFGYDFQPEKHWIAGPTLGATYTHLDVNSFNETGAGPADLNVSSQSADSVRSRLGGHVVYQTHSGSILWQPNFTAMWQHEYLNGSSGITSQFNIPGTTPFSIQTAAPSRDSALLGCGVTATLDNSMVLYLNYLADVGAADYFAQSVEGGFKASF